MSRREFFKVALMQFFIIVTLINVVMAVLGVIFRPDERFGYDAFLAPLIYAACSMIPVLLTYSKRELTVKQMIIRQVLNLLAIEAIMIGIGLSGSNVLREQPLLVVSLALSVFIIFVLVLVISWILDLGQAKQMNIDLENYKKRGCKKTPHKK